MKNVFQYGTKAILCLCEIVVGVLLFMDPMGFTGTIIKVGGILLVISGVLTAVQYFRTSPAQASLSQGLAKALCALTFGLFCLFKTDWFLDTFPIITVIYGIVIVFTGIIRIQWMVDMLRMRINRWYLAGIGAVLSLIFGCVILANPFESTKLLWKFVAAAMIVNAVADLAAILFARAVEAGNREEI